MESDSEILWSIRTSNWFVSLGSDGLLRKLLATPKELTCPPTFGSGNIPKSLAAIGSHRVCGILLPANGTRTEFPPASVVVVCGSKMVLYPEKSPVRQASGGTEAKKVWPVRMRVP